MPKAHAPSRRARTLASYWRTDRAYWRDQLGFGCRINGRRIIDCGEKRFDCVWVMVGLQVRGSRGNGFDAGRPNLFTRLIRQSLLLRILHHGATPSWTTTRMRCRCSSDKEGQAAITSWSARSSGTNWALIDDERVVSGWGSDGEELAGVDSLGQVTTPDCGFPSGCREQEGKWRRRESNLILALSPIQQIRMESHFPAPLLNLTNPPSPPAYHPHTIQMPSV